MKANSQSEHEMSYEQSSGNWIRRLFGSRSRACRLRGSSSGCRYFSSLSRGLGYLSSGAELTTQTEAGRRPTERP